MDSLFVFLLLTDWIFDFSSYTVELFEPQVKFNKALL